MSLFQPDQPGTLAPLPPEKFGPREARHLLWRAGLGGTQAQVRTLVDWGLAKSVDALLSFANTGEEPAPEEPALDASIRRPPTEEERRRIVRARRNGEEDVLTMLMQERQERDRKDREQMARLQNWWLQRMIETASPLQEKLTLFWHGHFATAYRGVEDSYHMYVQNRFFRENAAGNFADLLGGIIRDPAMLAYLDNNESRKNKPNENLARELMELFSLGVGNYTETDIKEGARALTGYGFDDDAFVFRSRNHDPNTKTILGSKGRFDGDGFVGLILRRRQCAAFIARKLYHFFVADLPGLDGADAGSAEERSAFVRGLGAALWENNYALAPTLRALFMSEHFYAEGIVGEQIKSPALLVVGAARSLRAPVRDLSVLNDAMDIMGQRLFHPPSVKGWDGGRGWINTSTLFARQNTLAYMLTGVNPRRGSEARRTNDFAPVARELVGDLSRSSPQQAAERVAEVALTAASNSTTKVLADHFRAKGKGDEALVDAFLLATAAPEYQLC